MLNVNCIVFPGQGSQHLGMGKHVFADFKDLVNEANEFLGYDIEQLCLKDPNRELSQTAFTQPALFFVNALSYINYRKHNPVPDFFLGHSLGEYNALHAAGAFDIMTGLKLTHKRGELFNSIKDGGMLAVLGNIPTSFDSILQTFEVDVANYNSEEQVILSGNINDLNKLQSICNEKQIKTVLLNVSGAFHSRFMEPAANEFKLFLDNFDFNILQVPVLSNYNAQIYSSINLKEFLTKQITSTVLWEKQIKNLLNIGVTEFTEIGPGTVLTRIVEVIKKKYVATATEFKSMVSDKKNCLGSKSFIQRYNLSKAYVTGGMYKAISSSDLVIKAAKAGFLSFYGAGGMSFNEVKDALEKINNSLDGKYIYGVNFISDPTNASSEMKLVQLCIAQRITVIEASAFVNITLALVFYRLKGLKYAEDGSILISNKIMAKISHPDVARAFLSPPPINLVENLYAKGEITYDEMNMSKMISMADEVTLEADSGGHTDQKSPFVLVPDIIRLRNEISKQYNYASQIHIGAAGGLGTPEAVASAFMLGADYVVTGSINQCTKEAGTSDMVKDLLSKISIHDTAIAPAGDMFEFGAKVQVMKKGSLFSSRANRLYEIYRQYGDLDLIDHNERINIEKNYFRRPLIDVWSEVESFLYTTKPDILEKIQTNPKAKLAYIFKWYFFHSTKSALSGSAEHKLDFQVQCGPALGAFNYWVKGSELENWNMRGVDTIGLKLMIEAEQVFSDRYNTLFNY